VSPDALLELTRRLNEGQLVPRGAGTPVRIGHTELERLLPHRPPMLLVDTIDLVDLHRCAARGHRYLDPNDPVFAGDDLQDALYPAGLVVEAIGQLALTVVQFAETQRIEVPEDAIPLRGRAVHIHHATFLAPLGPGDTMTLHVQAVGGGMTIVAAGQAWNDDTLAAIAIAEMHVEAPRGRRLPDSRRDVVQQVPRRHHARAVGHLALEEFLD
jgi:3-hydroxyacyl-[acyl-carrier-protein] dehydratase